MIMHVNITFVTDVMFDDFGYADNVYSLCARTNSYVQQNFNEKYTQLK